MTNIVILLFLLLSVAVITDHRSDKIPNLLIIVGMVIGIVTTNHFFESISSFLFIILIFFPLFCIGALGAGDIKCIAMISFYLTQQQLLWAVFYTFLLASVFSVCKIIFYRSFEVRKSKVHLAVPILLGTLISVGGTYL